MTPESFWSPTRGNSDSTSSGSAHGSGGGPIRILYFITAPFLGGVHVGLRNILRELDRSKFLPLVVQPEEQKKMLQFFDEVGVETATIHSSRLSQWRWTAPVDLLRATWELCRLVRCHRIQIVHSTAPRAAIVCLLVKWIMGIKFVWQAAVLGQPWYMRWLGRFPDRTTCVSRAVYEQMGGGNRPNVQLLWNGVWAEELSEADLAERRKALRDELGIWETDIVLGCVANLVYWKGVHVLLRAFAEVPFDRHRLVLVHLGGSVPGYETYATEVDSLIGTLGLRRRVIMLGFRPDAQRFYPLFDFLVHVPTYEGSRGTTEAFGQQIAEAMAYRLPVIASRCGGPAGIVEDGVTGLLVEPGDFQQLAQTMLALLRDPERQQRMGQAGFERYQRFFTIAREVCEYESLYRRLANGGHTSQAINPTPSEEYDVQG